MDVDALVRSGRIAARELADHIGQQRGAWNEYSRFRPFARSLPPADAAAGLILAAAEYAKACNRSVDTVLAPGIVTPNQRIFQAYLRAFFDPIRAPRE